MHKVFDIRLLSCQAVEKRPSVPRFAGLSGGFPMSRAGKARCGVEQHSSEHIYAFSTRDFVAPRCGTQAGAF
jgi:hypothetical protein